MCLTLKCECVFWLDGSKTLISYPEKILCGRLLFDCQMGKIGQQLDVLDHPQTATRWNKDYSRTEKISTWFLHFPCSVPHMIQLNTRLWKQLTQYTSRHICISCLWGRQFFFEAWKSHWTGSKFGNWIAQLFFTLLKICFVFHENANFPTRWKKRNSLLLLSKPLIKNWWNQKRKNGRKRFEGQKYRLCFLQLEDHTKCDHV